MSILVDTCGWIEWLTDGTLADHYAEALLASDELIVPTSVQFELYKWVRRERGEALALEAVALTERGQVVPLTSAIALLAADFALDYKLSFADAIIYATSRQMKAMLLTSGDHFEGLPEVRYIPKP
jgi:predicted nucleic acid-binding protein